jgi:hypothetical protein
MTAATGWCSSVTPSTHRPTAPASPVARRIMQTAMPLVFKVMNFEKTIGPEQRYAIDWDEHVAFSGV